MAKQIYEIKTFNKGINTGSSDMDISADSASFSWNVETRSPMGKMEPSRKNIDIGKELRAVDMKVIKTKDFGTCIVGFNPFNTTDSQGKKLGLLTIIDDIYGDNS